MQKNNDKRDAWTINALLEWIKWSNQRKFYTKPLAQNILAQFMPQESRPEKTIRLSMECNAFNSVINDMTEAQIVPFLVVYGDLKHVLKKEHDELVRSQNQDGTFEYEYIKKKREAWAIELDISESQFYRTADNTAKLIKARTLKLISFYEGVQIELTR